MSTETNPPKNAIVLGPEKCIESVDLTGRYERAVNIDPLIGELEPMWSALETECDAGCCGIGAFNFQSENIANARRELDAALICVKLRELRLALNALGAEVVVSSRLNNYADRRVFEALLSHLEANFCAQRDEEA